MSLTKIVDGVVVPLTQEEEAAVLAEWQANAGPIVPEEVLNYQARQALILAGLIDDVEAALDAMPEPQRALARNAWERRPTIRRNSELTQALASSLGLSAEQVNSLFIQAATL